ncbi:hypothetical protein [Nonomuraea typhae]|uniref:DUF3800 domain-containing protein n=1 Tax=Nonomuraea typhae TaxID=2603600 RepID=A0ABW7YKE3_9ACTN
MNAPSSAYVDESMVLSHGRYLLVAVLVAPADAAGHRDVLRSLLEHGQGRLHWRHENDKRRRHLIEVVAEMHPVGVVVVGTHLDAKKQERGRRKCLERLFWELGGCHVDNVVLERRHNDLDRRDREMVAALRGCHAIPPRLRPEWCDPGSEPLLWLPDMVAGARARAERGDDCFWRPIDDEMRVVFVDTR